MKCEWTEKEPVVSEWPYEKETKKEPLNAEQPPKLSLKMLYGLIQELRQDNERLAARLDEFEIYMIQVQAARAQLEASAATTIAKTKAAAASHERTDALHDDAAVNADAAAAGDDAEVENAAADAVVNAENRTAPAFADAVADQEQQAAADAPIGRLELLGPPVYTSAAEIEAAPAADAPTEMGMKPAVRESGSDDLMTLAMEVLGYTNDEDGLDPGEGINPFDPDNFASGSGAHAYAAAGASPEMLAQPGSPGTGLTSPFFMPRSQRHQGAKKKFLNLFGFRTRIS